MKNKYFDKFREFLNSGTPNAKIVEITLCLLAIASIPALVLIAASMGNAVQLFGQFKTSKRFSKKQITDSFIYLQRQKLIEYIADKNGKTIVGITKKGETRLRAFDIDLIKIKKPKKWDGKWRLVMFDIPIRFTKGREALRYHLKELDFFQFQKSAWIYPYPCEDEIIFIADFFGVGKYVEVLTAESILRDEKIKRHFGFMK
ncbi:MAG: phenylacetic acid degradation operon negative regulatory protein [Parcubacteria group bacterium Gr01-1014_24]|nr:MAG: phenylacetic acid degradation operon negative regulatory protein [Parcubacteria group bacterium Gr01-1014_24]